MAHSMSQSSHHTFSWASTSSITQFFSRRFYTSKMEDQLCLWDESQWQIFKELAAIHDFKGICKDAIKTAKDLKKKFGDKLTEEKILNL